MERFSTVSERILRLRNRYQTEVPKISIERAKYFTEKWEETKKQEIPQYSCCTFNEECL